MKNKYPGRCATCGKFVAPGKGATMRLRTGKWVVHCVTHTNKDFKVFNHFADEEKVDTVIRMRKGI